MEGANWTGELLGGRYRVAERLAVGGMGEVYRGVDLESGGDVAVKVPHASLVSDPAFSRRLFQEAETVASLDHPNVVRLLDRGEHEGHPYLVMELVPGGSLAEALRRDGALPLAQALHVTREVLAALEHAHARGVLHRDVKPGNVLLDTNGTAKLVDFGIAHAGTQAAATLTGAGEVLGSLYYLAPERLAGQAATPASDLYGVGVVLYQMLTGQVPFAGDLPAVVAARHLQSDPEPPSRLRPGLPVALDYFVAHALAKDPARRFPSAATMVSALDRLEAGANGTATARFAVPAAATNRRGGIGRGAGEWLGARARLVALAGALFLTAAVLWYAFAVAQPEAPVPPAVVAGPVIEVSPTPVPTPSPTPSPAAPQVAQDGDQEAREVVTKQSEQAKKRLEQLKKQQERNDKKRGRD